MAGKHSAKRSVPKRWLLVAAGIILLVAVAIAISACLPRIYKAGEAKEAEASGTVTPALYTTEEEEGWEVRNYPNPGNRILPESLPPIPPQASRKRAAQVVIRHKAKILNYAKHDPEILRYYLARYGYPAKQIPTTEQLHKDLDQRKRTYYALEGMVQSASYRPVRLKGGDYYNDGMTGSGVRTTQASNYGAKGVPAVEVTYANGQKGYYKPVCGNFQLRAPAKGAKQVRRYGPRPTRRDRGHRPWPKPRPKPCPKPSKPPINKYPWTTPHHPDNPYTQPPTQHVAKPTEGVTRGEPEEVRDRQDDNAGTRGPVQDGRSGEGNGGTTQDGGNEESSPPPNKPPSVDDDKQNEGDPGGF